MKQETRTVRYGNPPASAVGRMSRALRNVWGRPLYGRDLEALCRAVARTSALEAIMAVRLAELLEAKGPCSSAECGLHYAHSGPCATTKRGDAGPRPQARLATRVDTQPRQDTSSSHR